MNSNNDARQIRHGPTSTPAVTSRGMKEPEMREIGRFLDQAVEAARRDDEAALDLIAGTVRDFCRPFPAPGLEHLG